MNDVSVFLLCISAIFLIGIIGELVFAKTGIPDVVWLILVGIVLGPVSGLVSKTSLQEAAPYFGALTLVIVLFDGGSELKLSELSKAAARGSAMAIFGFILAVLAVAPVAMAASSMGIVPGEWTWTHGILLGTILGGSSSVVIMPALRKAGLSPKISNLVNLESALTDVLSVVATGAVIQLMIPRAGGEAAASAPVMLLKNFGIGIGIGLVAGMMAVLVLRPLKKSAYAYPLTLGGLLSLYVLVDELGGSAALGILTAAVMIGNAPVLSKAVGLAKEARLGKNVKGVHGEFAFIIKSFFFCFIGAMLGPPWGGLLFGIFIGLILLVARIPNVLLVTARTGMSKPARGLVSILFPRGMAAGVLAMMPHQMGVPHTRELPVVVFAAVFTTILLFAGGFPVFKKKLPPEDLIDMDVAKGKKPAPDESSASMSDVPAGPALAVQLGGPADATQLDPSAGIEAALHGPGEPATDDAPSEEG